MFTGDLGYVPVEHIIAYIANMCCICSICSVLLYIPYSVRVEDSTYSTYYVC